MVGNFGACVQIAIFCPLVQKPIQHQKKTSFVVQKFPQNGMTHSLWLVNYFEFTLSKCLKEKRLGMVEKRAGLWEGGGKGRAMMGVEL